MEGNPYLILFTLYTIGVRRRESRTRR
jgi:hypothetical protein